MYRVWLCVITVGSVFAAKNGTAVIRPYVRASNLDANCSKATSGEGKYGYTYSKSLACCDADGLKFTKSDEIFKTTTGDAAICCIAESGNYTMKYQNTKIACCNNRYTRYGRCNGRSAAKQITLQLSSHQSCKDKSKPFHVITTRKLNGKQFSGDTCCSTDKLHMIAYDKACCSTSYSPCFQTKESGLAALAAPPCCGASKENDFCNARYQRGIGNNPSEGEEVHGRGFFFCSDNEAGAWNVTSQLTGLPRLGFPFYPTPKILLVATAQISDCCWVTKTRAVIITLIGLTTRGFRKRAVLLPARA